MATAVSDGSSSGRRDGSSSEASNSSGEGSCNVGLEKQEEIEERLGGASEDATPEWREIVVDILGKQEERTSEEGAVVRGFTRGHTEVTTTKEKEAAAELAATRRAATEKAGSNMGRYDEILERNKALEDMEGREEEWEEIVRLHGEAMEGGEGYFFV